MTKGDQRLSVRMSAAMPERHNVRLDAADEVISKREQVTEGESVGFSGLEGALASPRDHDDIAVFEDLVLGEHRAAGECLVLDLAVEGLLAFEVPEPGEIPDDIVGQAGEDLLVIAAPEPVHVSLDHILA